MPDFPLLDPREREEFLAVLSRRAAPLDAPEGGLLHTLLVLYAGMLADTASRLNRTPEKHRIAFLNLLQTPRRASRPGETAAVFEVTAGYDLPVAVPQGSLLSAQTADAPVLYRTKRAFHAIPARITEIIWTDSETDTVQSAYAHEEGEPQKPFCLWDKVPPVRGRHTADFLFENVLIDADGTHEVYLETALTLGGKPIGSAVLTDPAKFLWSVHTPPDAQDEDTPVLCAAVAARLAPDGAIGLSYCGFLCAAPAACLRLELVDAALAGIRIERLCIRSFEEDIPPEAVLSGDRVLDAADFYPFQNPMRALEECFIFCGGVLLRPGAETSVTFDLTLEETHWKLPEEPEAVDYKWIMKRPKAKPEPEIAAAFARSVRWEYWNGAAYCELRGKCGNALDFTEAGGGLRLVFDCPRDLAAGGAGGRTGYFLRLSCGLCDTLYQLPRRVYTPRVQNLRFSYRYREPVFPIACTAESFGERQTFSPEKAVTPFCLPPSGQCVFVGLDHLPSEARIQFFLDTEARPAERQPFLSAHTCGDIPQPLAMDDGTYGLTRAGILSVVLPPKPAVSSLFGKMRYWLCFALGRRQTARTMRGIYLNAQWIENRVRRREHRSFSVIGRDGVVSLPHGNITRAWVFVRTEENAKQEPDNWTQWAEYALQSGAFREGFYTLDYTGGTLTFPPQISAYAARSPDMDFVAVTYDTCDGARGNVDAGAINRMQEELPFISAVYNPLPVVSGEDSETDEQLAARAEHRLSHSGHAVSARDFEWIAQDLYPQIREAKCVAGRPVRLALLLSDSERENFPRMRLRLLYELERIGCATAMGTEVEILEAVPVPMYLQIRFGGERHIPSTYFDEVKERLAAFLHPVTGGLRGDGWRIGHLPTYEQISACIAAQAPVLTLASLTVTAAGGGLSGDWREITCGVFHVPGEVRIELEADR